MTTPRRRVGSASPRGLTPGGVPVDPRPVRTPRRPARPGDARRRTGILCLTIVCAAAGLASFVSGPLRVGAADRAVEAEALVARADRSLARGLAAQAEADLRSALARLPDHDGAANRLSRLGASGRIAPETDEAAVATLMERLGSGFRRTTTRHFVIVSDCDPAWTRAREALLERTYREVRRFAERLGVTTWPPEHRLVCVLIEDHDVYDAFARTLDDVRAHWIAGYYSAGTNRVVFYNDATGPAFMRAFDRLAGYEAEAARIRRDARAHAPPARRAELLEHAEALERHVADERDRLEAAAGAKSEAKTVHEAAHLVAFNCGLQHRTRQYPFWITEGLATSFETDDSSSRFGPGYPYEVRERDVARLLGEGRFIPLDRFVALTEVPGADHAAAEVVYTQAYALFRYIARHERQGLGGLLAAIAGGPAGVAPDGRFLALFERWFGDVSAFEARWLRHERARAGL